MHHGLSRTTVSELREEFAHLFFAHTDLSNPRFLKNINQTLEYLFSQGDYRGNSATFNLPVATNGKITLPYYLETIKGARINGGLVRPVMSQGIEFLHNGPGDLENAGLGLIVSDGEGPTQTEFPAGETGTVTFTSTQEESDSTKSIRVYGLDEDGEEVRTATGSPGIPIAIGVESEIEFSAITGIVKPITNGRITLMLNLGDPLVLSKYEPSLKNPIYHRYKVDPVDEDHETSYEFVMAWCSRRFIPVTKEEDFVCPGTIRGWKLALSAQAMEDDADKNLERYLAMALETFNLDVEKFRRAEIQPPNIHLHGPFVGGVYTVK